MCYGDDDMEIFLNGKQVQTDSRNLADLTSEQHLQAESLIIEVNGTIIPEKEWNIYPLSPGDRVEFLHFVGGG